MDADLSPSGSAPSFPAHTLHTVPSSCACMHMKDPDGARSIHGTSQGNNVSRYLAFTLLQEGPRRG